MAKKYYTYNALANGTVLANGNATQANALGATTIISTNGTLSIASDAPTGFTNSVSGTDQGTSGTSYVAETVPATSTLSFSIYFKISSLGTLGMSVFWAGVNAARSFQINLTSSEQITVFNASAGNVFTTTVSGGFVANAWYRLDGHATVGSSTSNGVFQFAAYIEHNTTPIAGTSFSTTTMNIGTGQLTNLRHGTRISTGTADSFGYVRAGHDTQSAYMMGPQSNVTVDAGADQIDIEPWTTVSLQATGSNGTPTWSHVSGPNPTLVGTGASVTFTAPASFTVSTSVFRAAIGAVTDDVSITYLPATDGLVTSTAPLTVLPIRYIRKT